MESKYEARVEKKRSETEKMEMEQICLKKQVSKLEEDMNILSSKNKQLNGNLILKIKLFFI